MLKNICKLECIVNEKSYQLLCDMDSPIECVKAALEEFQKYVLNIEENIKAQMKEKDEANEPLDSLEEKPEELNVG